MGLPQAGAHERGQRVQEARGVVGAGDEDEALAARAQELLLAAAGDLLQRLQAVGPGA
jgi:hypothetical protein